MKTLSSGRFFGSCHKSAALGNGLILNEMRYAAGTRIPLHAHESPYLALVIEGAFGEVCGNRERQVKRRDFFFHPAGHAHHETFAGSPVRIFTVQFTSDFLRRSDVRMFMPGEPLMLRCVDAAAIGHRAHVEFLDDDPLAGLAAEAYVLELLVAVGRRIRRGLDVVPRWLRGVRESLTEHYIEPPSLTELALRAGVHPGHVSRAFRHAFGCTLTEYVRKVRIANALELLADPERPLVDIALSVGYSDQSHFSTAFRRETGRTPATHHARCRMKARM